MSHPECGTAGLLRQTQTPQRISMQVKENLTKVDPDECCVIAEIPRRKTATPSSTKTRKHDESFQEKSTTNRYDLFSLPLKDDGIDDIEIIKAKISSKRFPLTETPQRNSKFFNTHRSLSQSKVAKSRRLFKSQLKNKGDLLQESYRFTEKLQYMQLLQSHTSSNKSPAPSSNTNHQKNKRENQTIPVVDLTTDKNNAEAKAPDSGLPLQSADQDVQVIREVPLAKTYEDIIKMRSVSNETLHEMIKDNAKDIPEILSLIAFGHDAITLSDDDEKEKEKEREREREREKEDVKEDVKKYSQFLQEQWIKFMQITELSTQEVKDDSEEQGFLPELTPEEENKVEEALKQGYSQEVLAVGFGITIKRCDMQTLSGLNWLNDEIINFYMHLIMERSKNDKTLPKVYTFNTFFYSKLVSSGYASLRRWTKQVDIFSFDVILIPMHKRLHWCLSAIDFRCKSVKYYDSIGSDTDHSAERLLSYLESESLDKKNEIFPVNDWEKGNAENIPQQMNGSDCGVFTCEFAEHVARDSPLLFSQDNMPYFRKKIALEILEKKLLT